jgi:hypothetical protein
MKVINAIDVRIADGTSKTAKCRMKRCLSELHAKVKLEKYLKDLHPLFKSLVVSKCGMDPMSLFDFMFE